MIEVFRRFLHRRPIPGAARSEEADAFLRTSPASMPEVRPPAAVNDDPLRPVYAEVERELRVAGLIR